MPSLTPVKAIRKFCLHCVDGETQQVTNCTGGSDNPNSYQCPLFPYRMGNNPRSKAKLSVLKSIRLHCYDCCGGDMSDARFSRQVVLEVKNCLVGHKMG